MSLWPWCIMKPYDVFKEQPFPRSHSFVEKIFDFSGLNRFFLREGKTSKRDMNEDVLVSPVEGKLVEIQTLQESEEIHGKHGMARNENYTFEEIIHGSYWKEPFQQGQCFNLYLSPLNLHYVLFPTTMTVKNMEYHPAFCWPILFMKSGEVRNERLVIYAEMKNECPIIIVLIGSFLVSGIECVAKVGETYHTGDLLGGFKLGSTVMVLVPHERVVSLVEPKTSLLLCDPFAHVV